MFIRFVQLNRHPATGRRNGFFDAAYDVRNSELVNYDIRKQCQSLIEWYVENLKKPSRFNRSRSKGAWRRNTMGLSWFKPTAEQHIQKAHELAAVLSELGFVIEILKTDRPGYIVYEDEFQIVAEPFSDTPT